MNMELLTRVLTAYGATGREGNVRAVIEKELAGHADSVRTDALGNLIAVRKGDGTGRRVMLSAHMDHIALVVIDADEHGFLRVCAAGGVPANKMVAQHVTFENGQQGAVGVDEDAPAELTIAHLYVDIGADSREEALARVPIGEFAVAAPRVASLGEHRLSSPAMDDRIACYALLEVFCALPDSMKNEVVAVFSVQEEVGLRGATAAAYSVEPDVGLALDVTATGDVPGAKRHLPMKLGAGAAVKILDRDMIATPWVVDRLLDLAKEKSISVQREVLPFGGTDAAAIQRSRGGVPSGTVSIPCRYVHSAAETVDLRDVQAAIDLTRAFVCGDLL